MSAMVGLLLLFVPFFALVLLGWAAARTRFMPLDGIPAMNSFVLFFGLSAMVFRLAASGALIQPGLLGLLLTYGLAGSVMTLLALIWSARAGVHRRDAGMLALVTAFPNTGFLGLPLLTGLLGVQAAGPLAATLIVDVLILSSVCLAWSHSHGVRDPVGDDPLEAWHAVQSSLKGALRNPLLWSMGVGLVLAELGWHLPKPVDETVRLLSLSATPVALFTLGAILARAQMQAAAQEVAAPVEGLSFMKLVLHPLLIVAFAWSLRRWGVVLTDAGVLTVTLAAALPSASNVSMLAEREGANTALVAKVILWTTSVALVSLSLWAHVLGVSPVH
jgi:predicted permease